MISMDSNILLYAFDTTHPLHTAAREFLEYLKENENVIISEFALTEFYGLVRNPVLFKTPLSALEAVGVVNTYRTQAGWRLAGFPEENASAKLHEELWRRVSEQNFAFRRIYDTRFALVLRHFGVREFATANVKHFQEFGFDRVWNPLVRQDEDRPRR